MAKYLFIPVLLILVQSSMAQDYSLYQKRVFTSKDGKTLNYRILYPKDYDLGKKYPVLLFLHGSGERGNDNEKQLVHGGDLFLNPSNMEKFPAIILFPQCPEGKSWSSMTNKVEDGKKIYQRTTEKKPGEMSKLLMGLITDTEKKEKVDKKRIYIMGLSMGGFGTFDMLYLYPNTFAAAVPICGGHLPELAGDYAKKVPIWLFHGAKDNVVSPDLSRNMYAKLKELGAEVKYTEFPDANHNSWDSTFATPELLPWIFSHHK
jgi:predicted peptidase